MSFSSNYQSKKTKDTKDILEFIYSNDNKKDIISMYLKGPPEDTGFMWARNAKDYWTEGELKALGIMEKKLWGLGWDSSGYGLMQRIIEHKVNELETQNK